MNTGIYVITAPSGRQYVGSSVNMRKRWRAHCNKLRVGQHHNQPLQNAWAKHSGDGFTFKVLLYCAEHDLLMFEQRALDILRPELNVLKFAYHSTGWKHTDETRAKLSHIHKGVSRPGHPQSQETIEKLRKLKTGCTTGRKGIPQPQSVKDKISATSKGRVFGTRTPEWAAHIADAHRRNGHAPSREATDNSANNRRGIPRSPETKAKRLASYLKTVAERKRREQED